MRKFAFLVHPRDISDMARPLPWIKYIPDKVTEEIIKRLKGRLGFIVWSKFNVYDKVEGWIIFVSLTGEQIMTLPRKYVQNRILDAVLYAQDNLKVDLVGLGAYITPITNAGQWIVKQDRININVTHGDSFSVAIAFEGLNKIADKLNRPLLKNKLALIGAYGLIGKALAQLLVDKCATLYLIGRNRSKLEALHRILSPRFTEIITSLDLDDVKNCDYVVTATSYSKALIHPHHLKKEAIVYDIAQPINLHPSTLEARPDVLRIDGCYVKIPGIDLGVDMGPPPGTTFSCLAETIMQALEGNEGNYVGEISLEYVETTMRWGKKYGFTHADFTNYSIPLKL